jgi:hypothetical protein
VLGEDALVAGITDPTDGRAITVKDHLESRSISGPIAQDHRFGDLERDRTEQLYIWNADDGALPGREVLPAVLWVAFG